MNRPRAVVFDLGKVLLDFDYARAVSNLAQHCAISAEELLRLLNQSPLLHRYETGLLTTSEFYEQVKRASSFCHGFEEFEPLFGDIFTVIPEMVELNTRLRARRIPTYIFSNTNEMAVRHIQRTFPFFREFTGHIYSFQHKAMKPDPRIYEVVESRTGCRASELLYIDDRLENITAGAARGWQTIHHRRPEKTIPAVEALFLG